MVLDDQSPPWRAEDADEVEPWHESDGERIPNFHDDDLAAKYRRASVSKHGPITADEAAIRVQRRYRSSRYHKSYDFSNALFEKLHEWDASFSRADFDDDRKKAEMVSVPPLTASR